MPQHKTPIAGALPQRTQRALREEYERYCFDPKPQLQEFYCLELMTEFVQFPLRSQRPPRWKLVLWRWKLLFRSLKGA